MLKLIETQDGSKSIFSEQFGVSYHSKYGALQESRHVFIESGLFYKAIIQKQLKVLDIGFGTGLNAFLTYQESIRLGLKVHYTTIEAFPVEDTLVADLGYPNLLQAGEQGAVFYEMHQNNWGTAIPLGENFTFVKLLGKFEEVDLPTDFDLVYYDAFAPNAQPELWEVPMMQKMFDALRPGGVLVTYCAKGAFRRILKAVGFEVETLQGPPGKREMTRATKPEAAK